MMHLLAARRRYLGMRKALPCDCAFDLDTYDELTRVIRRLDRMIAEAPDETEDEAPDDRPSPALSGAGPRPAGRRPARHHHSAR